MASAYLKASAKKIPFRVLSATSSEDDHPAGELETGGPFTSGWKSCRFCLYPQEIIIQLEQTVRVRMIQLLSHSSMISSKVELFAATKYEQNDQSTFSRLGYVSFSDNVATEYKTRELKSVYVDCYGTFIKLVLHCNHINKWNLYNQVGVIAINILADEPRTKYEIVPRSESEETELISLSSPHEFDIGLDINDQNLKVLLNKPVVVSHTDDIRFTMTHDPITAELMRKLDYKMKSAANAENYEVAKRLQSVLKELSIMSTSLCQYEIEKREAVTKEDYDSAKEIKIKMDLARDGLYHRVGIDTIMDEIRREERREGEKSKNLSKTERSELSPSVGISREQSYMNLITPETSFGHTDPESFDEEDNSSNSKMMKSPKVDAMLTDDNCSHSVDASVVEQLLRKEQNVTGVVSDGIITSDVDAVEEIRDVIVPVNLQQGSVEVEGSSIPILLGSSGEEVAKTKQQWSEPASTSTDNIAAVFGAELVSKMYSKDHSERKKMIESVMDILKSFPKDGFPSSSQSIELQLSKLVSATTQVIAKGLQEKTFTMFAVAQELFMYIIEDFASEHG